MGEFYGVVYARGVERSAVERALEQVAARQDCCFFLAPEIRGWTAIYPSNDQDETVSRRIHRRLKSDILQVIVHDGDIFAYSYYREGRLADQFNSRPDYFGAVSAQKERALRGDVEKLAGLLRDPADLDKLLASLIPEADEPCAGTAMLERFASALGLPNSAASYDILMQEEDGEEFGRRGDFLHLPDLTLAKGKRKMELSAAALELKKMRDEGLLLFAESPAPAPPRPDPSCGGFLLWAIDTRVHPAISRVTDPWTGQPTTIPLQFQKGSGSLVVSPSGCYVAVSVPTGTELRELGTLRLLLDSPYISPAGFTPDEKVLITTGNGILLVSIPDGNLIRTIPVRPENGVFAIHPQGEAAVAAGGGGRLFAVNLADGRVVRSFHIDNVGQFDLTVRMQLAFVAGIQGQHLHKWADHYARATGLPVNEVPPITAEDPTVLRFSGDGRFLLCATAHGAWVYDWQALLNSTDSSPTAFYHFQPPQTPLYDWWNYFFGDDPARAVFDLAHDNSAHRVLLACGDGNVRQVDIATRRESVLLAIPGAGPVWRMGLSPGGGLLYTIDRPEIRRQHLKIEALRGGSRKAASVEKERPSTMRLWDYRKL